MFRYQITIIFCLTLILAAAAMAKPATYVFDIKMPSSGTPFQQPSGLTLDARSHELYVADAGNNRVVIFDKHGNYDFSFVDNNHLFGPRQIAVDSLGRIFVLGSNDKIAVFDYDGAYLRDLDAHNPILKRMGIRTFCMDNQDRIYVLVDKPIHLYVFSSEGESLYDKALFTDIDDADVRNAIAVGNISLVNGDLMIPLPGGVQEVYRCTTEGKTVRSYGMSGSGEPGGLSFPVAVTSDGQGGIFVLDRMRNSVVQFKDDGKFVTEQGGQGISPGWFYLPGAIVSTDDGLCYVAQYFKNRIQAVRIDKEVPSSVNTQFATTDKPATVEKEKKN